MEINFDHIVKQIHAGTMRIGGTKFFSIVDFIEAHHERTDFPGEIFYQNIIHALLVGYMEKNMNNAHTKSALKYVKSKHAAKKKTAAPEPETETINEDLITRQDLMKRLHISEPTLIKRQKDGTIPFMRVGRRVLYDWTKVKLAMDSSRKKR